MSEIELFSFNGHQVRTIVVEHEPWFVATDVCTICALRDTSSALRKVDERDVQRLRRSDTPQHFRGIAPQVQEIAVVNESGLYDLVFQSTKQEARDFKRWVTSDLLPRYRRGELTAAPRELSRLELIDLARAAEVGRLEEKAAREVAEQERDQLAPAASAWHGLVDRTGDISVGEAAKALKRAGADTGPNRLFRTLEQVGWIWKDGRGDWRVKQSAIETGRLAERLTGTYEHPDTGLRVAAPPQVRVTFKGLDALHAHFVGARVLPVRRQLSSAGGAA